MKCIQTISWVSLWSVTAGLVFAQTVSGNRRPQEPLGPLPYRSIDVRIKNEVAGVELAGTLTLPSSSERVPAVILVTGAGPQDRDEQVAGHRPFLVLADHLTRAGLAVLRLDDRGVRESTGDFRSATILDFVSDISAAVDYLSSSNRVDPRRVALLGHSEGGLVAPLVALERPRQIACVVLVAAPGVTGAQIFYQQDAAEARAQGVPEEVIQRRRDRKSALFAVLKREPDLGLAAIELSRVMKATDLTAEEKAALASGEIDLEAMIRQQIQLLNTPAIRVFLKHDPQPVLARMQIPVFAITGQRDLQVPPDENLPWIAKALSESKCPSYTVMKLEGLNHLLQSSETGLPRDYAAINETIAPKALSAISDWLGEQLSNNTRQ